MTRNNITLFCLSLLVVAPTFQAVSDIYGNLIEDSGVRYPKSECCTVPHCINPAQCYHVISCGHICNTGKYPPAEIRVTPGYQLTRSYIKSECRFGQCRSYEFSCNHCQDPRKPGFSINKVRSDCKQCYYHI